MSVVAINPRARHGPASTDATQHAPAKLLSIGVATPPMHILQTELAQTLATIWGLRGGALARWRRIVAGTGIESRHGVLPPGDVIGLSTAERMRQYERHAPPLAAEAAQIALKRAGVPADRITDLVVVSCTGFSAPGLDVALVELLGLQPNVRRLMIGFMGCFGAISGLRAAIGACAANAESNPVALLVCAELCSLHMRDSADVQNQVASALFADGAAAAVVGTSRKNVQIAGRCLELNDQNSESWPQGDAIGALSSGASLLLPHGKDWMTWRITDAGFAMTLERDVPAALQSALGGFVRGIAGQSPRSFIVHPGGPGILDAVDSALNLHEGAGLQHSRRILRRFGNMSSSTVLFVLEEALHHGCDLPALMLAFGPGLTIESVMLNRT